MSSIFYLDAIIIELLCNACGSNDHREFFEYKLRQAHDEMLQDKNLMDKIRNNKEKVAVTQQMDFTKILLTRLSNAIKIENINDDVLDYFKVNPDTISKMDLETLKKATKQNQINEDGIGDDDEDGFSPLFVGTKLPTTPESPTVKLFRKMR